MSSRDRKAPQRFATLADWRASKGFTLQQAADFLDLPLTTYFNFERNIRVPRPNTMRALIAKTGVSVAFLARVA